METQDIQAIKSIVVHNDNHNSFINVIFSLMKNCNHNPQQAEQCAWIIHNNGKCTVKSGVYIDLLPICEALSESGINAEIV